MPAREKFAFTIYMIVACFLIAFGVIYLVCPTILPYHYQAIHMQWDEIDSGMQILLQAFMKVTAAGFFAAGFSVLILLLIPFRQGEKWAHRAIPALAAVSVGLALYVTIKVAMATGAATPWPVTAAGLVLIIVAYVLSPGTKRTCLGATRD